jgi:hypothetical protein
MPQVNVKYKYKSSNGSGSTTNYVTVSKNPPSESEILAELKKKHPTWSDFVIIEIK